MICLTFDTDYMSEERMAEFLATFDIPGAATFFCVERHEILEETAHEVGPHPFLYSEADREQELARARAEFPQAAGCRTHACLYSHMISLSLGRLGFRYASTQVASGQPLPIREPWGVWQLPIYYMDNADFSARRWWGDAAGNPFSDTLIEAALTGEGLYVFAFHPVHLLLNTPTPEHYLARRDAFVAGERAESLRFEGLGAAVFFERLRDALLEQRSESVALGEALDAHLAVLGYAQSRS